MQEKIHWITNLRGIACMMVVMIHSTSWYITHPHAITLMEWDIANLLNSASRVRGALNRNRRASSTKFICFAAD